MTRLLRAPVATLVRPDLDLVSAWDDLATRTGAGPFARPGWVHAIVDAFGGDLRLIVARSDLEVVGVAPFVGRRRLTTPTGWHTPWHETVAVGDSTRRSLWSRALDAPAVDADHLLSDGADAAVLEGLMADRGHLVRARPRQSPPYIDLDGDWSDFEASMTSKRRSDLRRRMRRLAEIGTVAFEVIDDPEDLDAVLEEGFRVEASGWKGRQGTAVGADPATTMFYRLVGRWARDRGWLRLGFLRVDGRAVAFDFSIETGGRHYLLKTGFDERMRQYAPGALLRREMIRWCYEHGVSVYEFTGDVAAWKREWAAQTRTTIRIQGFAANATGRALWAASRSRAVASAALKRVRSGG